jgi:hypothetical protein
VPVPVPVPVPENRIDRARALMDELREICRPLLESRRRLVPLGALLLFSFAYFVAAPAWNQNSRLALTRALVEDHTTAIDRFEVTTGDKSRRDGHFYSDKAPGASFLAVPVYAAFVTVRRMTGGELPDVRVQSMDPRLRIAGADPPPEERLPGDILVYNHAHRWALYLCGLFTVGLASVAGAGAVFLVARRWGASVDVAVWTALVYALGTPAFVYSTALYGHQLCGSLLAIAFALVTTTSGGRGRAVPLAAGSALGLAVITEYPAAPVAVAIVMLSAVHGSRFVAYLVAGGLPVAVLLAVYHTVAFGHPLRTGYDFVVLAEFAEGMRVAYGLGPPDPVVLWQITFGSYRGLFYLSPVLILAAWGLMRLALQRPDSHADRQRARAERWARMLALAVPGYFVLLNAGYYMWDGGAAAGPRHIVPALPFLALGLVVAWREIPGATAVLAMASVAQALLLTHASPEVAQFGDPLWEFAIDRFLARAPSPHATGTNVGLLLGLPGWLSLAPLLLGWWWAWAYVRTGRGS